MWASFGIGYQYENITLNVGYTHIFFLEDPETSNVSAMGTLKGYYTGRADVISFQAGISW